MEKPEERQKRTLGTEAGKRIPGMVKGMIARAKEAKRAGKPIAYCFIQSLYYEIVRAMDIEPVWVENYAGVCAAKRDAERFLDRAESEGFSRSTCTYATCRSRCSP